MYTFAKCDFIAKKNMKSLIKTLSIVTFLSATITVASIFYEGLILEWLSFVGSLIIITDILWNDLKIKLEKEGSEVSEKIGQLKLVAPDGKLRLTDVADIEQLFRLIQSIPSKKVEPFKLWLARVGSERIDELGNE